MHVHVHANRKAEKQEWVGKLQIVPIKREYFIVCVRDKGEINHKSLYVMVTIRACTCTLLGQSLTLVG